MDNPKPMYGPVFVKSLPRELRDKIPPRTRHLTLTIPHDGPVLLTCETLADKDFALGLMEEASYLSNAEWKVNDGS